MAAKSLDMNVKFGANRAEKLLIEAINEVEGLRACFPTFLVLAVWTINQRDVRSNWLVQFHGYHRAPGALSLDLRTHQWHWIRRLQVRLFSITQLKSSIDEFYTSLKFLAPRDRFDWSKRSVTFWANKKILNYCVS